MLMKLTALVQGNLYLYQEEAALLKALIDRVEPINNTESQVKKETIEKLNELLKFELTL